jgi:dihydroorotase
MSARTLKFAADAGDQLITVLDNNAQYSARAKHIQFDGNNTLVVSAENRAAASSSDYVLCRGLVDSYSRLCEPGLTHKASIHSEALAALASGITSLVCAPETEPRIDTTAIVELVRDRAAKAGGARVLPLAAMSKGLQHETLSEYPTLQKAGCVAISSGSSAISNNAFLRRALQYAKSFDQLVVIHPIDKHLSDDGAAHDGRIAARLGLIGIPESAETLALARDLMLIEETGVRAHISRVSCARSVELIRAAKRRGAAISCDVAIANLFLSENDLYGFDANYHVKPPLRSSDDRDALRSGLSDGTIDAICSNHSPHERDAKLAPFPMSEAGMSTLDVLLPLSLQLVREGVLSLPRWHQVTSRFSAARFGELHNDWLLLETSARVRISADSMQSRGKNCAFIGWELQGKVLELLSQ